MAKYLSDWLTEDFEMKNGEVFPKRKYSYKIDDKEFDIDPSGLWVQTFCSKENPNLIIRCIVTIKHPYCLALADKHRDIVKLHTAKREVIEWPSKNENLRGYAMITNEDGVWADGETSKDTLNKTMWNYANTMLMKRSEDRLILRALGLYQAGMYSDSEFGGDSAEPETYVSANTLSPEELEAIKLKKVMKEVRLLFGAISGMNSEFSPKVFTNTLLASDKASDQLTYEEWVIVKNAAEKEKTRLEGLV